MTKSFDSYQKRRLQSSYISVIISIALVLFMIGILGLTLLKSTKVANHFKEKVAMTLFLKDNVKKDSIQNLRTFLSTQPYTKKIIFVTKEEAAKTYSKDIGEDFLQFLGTNPLKDGIDLYLKADYVTPEKMEDLKVNFDKNNLIAEVSYDKPLITLLTKNIKRISFWLLILSCFFGLIAIILINSSIRLSIYARRFNIKTMQMVGATKGFIRRPFIWQSIKLGMIATLIALIGLGTVIYYLNKLAPSLALVKDYISLTYLVGGIIVTAFVITWLSTYFATQRFLNLQTDELYY
ncbi:cell division protein FtsX [Tenacibaculum sp. UWU-22]|uniref:cell division protein FtsX n=1 Tax=Tenacibaculum sp. UWU-22 TaxID=3234187 RepID=UPI0034DAD399